jgi:hypothetical protein
MNLTLLACVEKVGVQGTTKNIFYLMFTTIVTFEGLKVEELRVKFLSKGYDVNNVFQDARANVTTQMKENVVPFLMEIHFFTHQTNLVVLILSELSLVA